MLYEVKEEHRHIVENLLEILSVAEDKIVASSNIVLTECGDCLTGFYNADVNEMMIMKGYLELAIIQKSKSYGDPELIELNQECTECEEDEYMLYADTMQMLRFYLWIVAAIETLVLLLSVYAHFKYNHKASLVVISAIGCTVSYVFLVLSYFVRIRGIG